MLRPVLASMLAAGSIAAGFHTSVAAAPPAYVQCSSPALTIPISIPIAITADGSMRAAVQWCRSVWAGHPIGMAK